MKDYKQIKDFIEGKFREIQGILFDKIDSIAADNARLKEEKEKAEKRKSATTVLDVFIPFFSNVEELIMESSDNEGVQKQYKEIKRILVENLERKGIKVLDFPKGTEITEDNYSVLKTTEVSVNNREEAGRIVKTTRFGYHIPEENYINQAYVTVGAYQEPKRIATVPTTQTIQSGHYNLEKRDIQQSVPGNGNYINDREGEITVLVNRKGINNDLWNGVIQTYSRCGFPKERIIKQSLKKENDNKYYGEFYGYDEEGILILGDNLTSPCKYNCHSTYCYKWEIEQKMGELIFRIWPIKEITKGYSWSLLDGEKQKKETKEFIFKLEERI